MHRFHSYRPGLLNQSFLVVVTTHAEQPGRAVLLNLSTGTLSIVRDSAVETRANDLLDQLLAFIDRAADRLEAFRAMLIDLATIAAQNPTLAAWLGLPTARTIQHPAGRESKHTPVHHMTAHAAGRPAHIRWFVDPAPIW